MSLVKIQVFLSHFETSSVICHKNSSQVRGLFVKMLLENSKFDMEIVFVRFIYNQEFISTP